MDGSAEAFVEAIDRVGIRVQSAPKRFIKIAEAGARRARLGLRRVPAL